jgi:hypothetical protein
MIKQMADISEKLNAALLEWDGNNPPPDEVYYILTRLAEQALELRSRYGIRPLVSEKLDIAWSKRPYNRGIILDGYGTQNTRLQSKFITKP